MKRPTPPLRRPHVGHAPAMMVKEEQHDERPALVGSDSSVHVLFLLLHETS
jgi:hypothetical protein